MNIDYERFLSEFWQKRPVLLKQALPAFVDPLDAEELAGLACEPFCDARLVREQGGEYPWQVTYGPFAESELSSLPESHWTLLVRHVDKIIPQLADLKDEFFFAPDWRKEDVMVSFAPKGGTVGAHIDRYDVFLIQGMGQRQWDISLEPLEEEELEPYEDIRVLKDFVPDERFVLEPGDVLYIPPRFVHAGVSLEDSLTYSVGFRAPTREELCAGFWAEQAEREQDAERLGSKEELFKNPAELSEHFQNRAFSFVSQACIESEVFADWISRKMSEPDHGYEVESNPERSQGDVIQMIQDGKAMRRNEAARFLYRLSGDIHCYFGGRRRSVSQVLQPLIEGMGKAHALNAGMLQSCLSLEGAAEFLFELYEEGLVYFVDDMDWSED